VRRHQGRFAQLVESGHAPGWGSSQVQQSGNSGQADRLLGFNPVQAFGLSELRWDNERGYRLRGDGVGSLLGEMRDEVGMQKTEALSLTGIAIRVVVE
jgi:hypothetical protein